MPQHTLLDFSPPVPRGDTFKADRDGPRLSAQATRVYELMRDGHWRGLRDIAKETGDPEASVSARLRDLKAAGYGMEHKFVRKGLWHYRIIKP